MTSARWVLSLCKAIAVELADAVWLEILHRLNRPAKPRTYPVDFPQRDGDV